MKLTLPVNSAERKNYPIFSGVRRYAPAAIALMAKTSKDGNDKHNKGEPLHHARGKSADHGDCIDRHLMDVQDIEAAILRDPVDAGCEHPASGPLAVELGQLMWRTAIYVQEMAEKYLGAPLAPGARLPVPEPKPGTVTAICGAKMPGAPHLCWRAPNHAGHHDDGRVRWP